MGILGHQNAENNPLDSSIPVQRIRCESCARRNKQNKNERSLQMKGDMEK